MPPLIDRRAALAGLAAAAVSPALPVFAREAQRSLNLLAVGDWGRGGDFHQAEVAARMGETAAALDARLVISVGDNFYEDGVDGVDDPQWKTSFEDVYAAPALQVPWQVILGNHDYHGDAQAQLDFSRRSPRWRAPARWRSLVEAAPDGAAVEIFFLDTSPLIQSYYADGGAKVKVVGQDVKGQLAWFDEALAASKADWRIVVGHHPVWPLRSGGGGEDGGAAADMQAKIDPILRRHGVHLYLNGHDHDLQHVARGGVHYVCTGAGSKTRKACVEDGDFCTVDSGFVTLAISGPAVRLAYRDWRGAQRYVAQIDRA